MVEAAAQETAPPEPPMQLPAGRRLTPLQSLVRLGLTAVLLYLVFGVLIPRFAGYDEIWAALTSLTPGQVALLLALFVLLELLKPLTNDILVPGLGLRHALVADAAASAVSSTVPGPSGTAARFVFYRQYDVSPSFFGRATVANSLSNYLMALLAPVVGIGLLATQDDIGHRAWAIAAFGLVLAVVGGSVVGLVLRSERFAAELGRRAQGLTSRALGVVRRPAADHLAEDVIRFRTETLELLAQRWRRLALVVAVRYVLTFGVLLVSIRALGADRGALTLAEVFAVYAVVQMLVIVQLTPGGVGITEALYVTALALVAEGTQQSLLVAAVLVFRIVTYLLPIVLGAGCYLVVTREQRHGEPA